MTSLLSGLEIWTPLLIFTTNSIITTLHQTATATLIHWHQFPAETAAVITCVINRKLKANTSAGIKNSSLKAFIYS